MPQELLPEGTKRTIGRDAQRNNILAAKIVAETVRTTLGPKGMDKMIVDSLGDVIVTNDGVTILEEMQVEHPTAKMIIETAKTQENQVGDGTTTVVILVGELLKNAERLLDQEIHPTVITKGYRLASDYALKVLDKIAEKITDKDKDVLKKIAMTAMMGKGAEGNKELIADLLLEAARQVKDERGIDVDDIKVEKKVGGGIENSELISGIVLDKERVNEGMPRKVEKAKIALIDTAIEIKDTETDAKIQVNDPNQLKAFLDQEEKTLQNMVDQIHKSGANVVFCQKGIDDLAQYFLAKKGIYAVRRVKKSDMGKLSKATGAKVVTKISELNNKDLGFSGLVEERKTGDEEMTYVEECKNPKAVTLFVRGGTEHVVDEIERAIRDALGDLIVSLKDGKVVAGAGAPEIEIAKALRDYANKFSGREQLAIEAFADAMEIVPRTLSENAGLDPIDMLTDLKAKHDQGKKWFGLDVFSGKVVDSWKQGVIEPLKIKTQAVKSAAEVAELILRIDDVIAGSGKSNQQQMPPMGTPPGMM